MIVENFDVSTNLCSGAVWLIDTCVAMLTKLPLLSASRKSMGLLYKANKVASRLQVCTC